MEMHLLAALTMDELTMPKVIIPVLIVVLFVGVFFVIWAMAKRYKRIPPNAIGVIYGKKRTQVMGPDGQRMEVGFRLVTGGGVFIIPIIEDYAEMSTEAFQIEIAEENIPTKKNVGVHVAGVATCRISPVPEEQTNAVQNFLGKSLDEMKAMIREILRGHLRSIVGGLEIEELLRERAKFNEKVVLECSQELSRMGIRILTLVIQDVRDNQGYIEALGKQAVAGAKRDAQIAVAEAEKETSIRTSNAMREAVEVQNQNEAKVAEAQKELQMRQAQFKQETQTKQAEADMAGALAKTQQEQRLAVLQAERDSASAEAQIKVQEKEALRKQKELEATKIVEAEAEAKAMSIRAEGKRKAETIEAGARKSVAELNADTAKLDAQGKKEAAIQTGQGEAERTRIIALATAEATLKTKQAEAEGGKATLLAQADGEKAKLLAQAEGTKAARLAEAEGKRLSLNAEAEGRRNMLEAEANGKQKSLLAEAEGTNALAEALQKLSEQGKLILILDRLPALLDKGGDAGAKIAREVFGPIGTALGCIQSVNITDLGGGNAAKTSIANIGTLVPQIITDFVVQLKARGIDPTAVLNVLKLNPEGLVTLVDRGIKTASGAAPASAPAPSHEASQVPHREEQMKTTTGGLTMT